MTSSFVPPTQPSPTSNLHDFQQDPFEPFPTPRSNTLPPPRTIILEPPPFSQHGVRDPIIFVSISDCLVAISSKSVLSVFRLPSDCRHAVSSSDEPSSIILAQWPCPFDHCIAAMKLSPDASAIALIVHRPRCSAALVLLHAVTCDRLLRIALPQGYMFESTVSSTQSPISFISASTATSVATSPAPDDTLPARFRRQLGILESQNSAVNTRASAAESVGPLAQWALVVASSLPTSHVLLITFYIGYHRVHHLSYLTLPFTSVPYVIHPARILFDSTSIALVLLLPTLGYRLANSSFDQVVANCDVPMQSLLGIAQSGLVVSLCKRANGALAIAVIDEPTLTITSVPFGVSDVRAAALLTSPDGDYFVTIVPTDGFPRVVADLSLVPPRFVADVPQVRLRQDRVQNGAEDWSCAVDTPADVSMIGNTIVAAYADEERVVVRFTEYEEAYALDR